MATKKPSQEAAPKVEKPKKDKSATEVEKLTEELSAAEYRADYIVERLENILQAAKKLHESRAAGPRGILDAMVMGIRAIIRDNKKA